MFEINQFRFSQMFIFHIFFDGQKMKNNFQIPAKIGNQDFGSNETLVICGKKRSGKTNALQYLLYENRHRFQDVIVFGPDAYGEWVSRFPSIIAISKFDESSLMLVQNLLDSYNDKNNTRKLLLIWDDCDGSGKTVLNSSIFERAFQNLENINSWITFQCFSMIPIKIMKNLRICTFMSQLLSVRERSRVKEYLQITVELPIFNSFIDKWTQNYGCVSQKRNIDGDCEMYVHNFKRDLPLIFKQNSDVIFNNSIILHNISHTLLDQYSNSNRLFTSLKNQYFRTDADIHWIIEAKKNSDLNFMKLLKFAPSSKIINNIDQLMTRTEEQVMLLLMNCNLVSRKPKENILNLVNQLNVAPPTTSIGKQIYSPIILDFKWSVECLRSKLPLPLTDIVKEYDENVPIISRILEDRLNVSVLLNQI